jgi:hypothetical protein
MKLNLYRGLANDNWYKMENKGFRMKNVLGKGYLKKESVISTKALIEMDTISHEVSLIPYDIHTYS